MRQSSSHNQSSMAMAAHWVSVITTISLEMALPAAFGYWLDNRWGTKPWLIIVGAILGLITGMVHLLAMVKQEDEKRMNEAKDDIKSGK